MSSIFPLLEHLIQDGLRKEQQHSGRWQVGRASVEKHHGDHSCDFYLVVSCIVASSQGHQLVPISILHLKSGQCESYTSLDSFGLSVN